MMGYIWVTMYVTLTLFILWFVSRSAYRRGFHAGASKVLNEWKQYMNMGENNDE